MPKSPKTYSDLLNVPMSKNVSRETFLLIQSYIELLKKWQMTINLVSDSTIDEVWDRHIIDSLQLFDYIDEDEKMIDVGSGAGLPGLILAIAGVKNVTLVESDVRKAAFLREAAQYAEGQVKIANQRIEITDLSGADIVTARAFAPLHRLLDSLSKTLTSNHRLLLLKGKNYQQEIENAEQYWSFDYRATPSITDTEGVILHITSCQKKR